MKQTNWRPALADYVRTQAKPADKFSHQPRLYAVAKQVAQGQCYDEDVVCAAAWLHDLGVFIGHRPEESTALAAWDNVAYAADQAPRLLRQFGFPEQKIPAVVDCIRTHLPSGQPMSMEGIILRDADILEQLGAIGILRTVSKVGRDTRFVTFGQAINKLRQCAKELPGQLRLPAAREMAKARVETMEAFLQAVATESPGVEL